MALCVLHRTFQMQSRSSQTITIEGMLRAGVAASAIARQVGVSRPRVQQIKRRMGEGRTGSWIYIYYIEGTKIGYIGQSQYIDGRLSEHKSGQFPTTRELNKRAADQGKVTASVQWTVDVSAADLFTWERYYAEKYVADGWELVNVAPFKVVSAITLQDLQGVAGEESLLPSDSPMKSITIRFTPAVYDALVEACTIANRQDPEEQITISDYVEQVTINNLVEMGLVRKHKRK